MTKKYITPILLALATICSSRALAQDQFTTDFEPIRKELVSWDAVRGEWLSNSLVAIAHKEPIPDRMFPEDFTPMEMMKALPPASREVISATAQSRMSSPTTDENGRKQWTQISAMAQRAECRPVMGRTYGDPHLASFDGASYSFQTVGEFVLVKSASGNMEIQTRQRAQTDDISLNTAVAMNVAGDRLCFYSQEKPDGNSSTPIRLNGEALYVDDITYYLPHGGTIRKSGRTNYLVSWPTGETATLDIRNSSFNFINLSVQVYPCADTYEGILGNANGRSSDDFETRGNASRPQNLVFHTFGSANDPAAQSMEREYLAWMAKDFARSWRVEQPTSLFDYGFGQSTLTFTDESFPRVHHTLADLSPDQRDRARRNCERNGVDAMDMNGCIYDQAYINIPPSPRPVVPDHGRDVTMRPITKPMPNVNPGGNVRPTLEAAPVDKQPSGSNNNGGALPLGKQTSGTPEGQVINEGREPGVATPAPVDSKETNSGTVSPQTQPVKPIVVEEPKPAKPVVSTPQPVVSDPEPTQEKGRFGRFLETVGGSSSSGSSGSSGNSGSSGSSGNSRPTSTSSPLPRQSTPSSSPAPKQSTPPPAPAPQPVQRTPAPSGRGGR